ncbi:hypothetical protein JCM17961_21210 [Endothiovibrio diazotrophicus]
MLAVKHAPNIDMLFALHAGNDMGKKLSTDAENDARPLARSPLRPPLRLFDQRREISGVLRALQAVRTNGA